MFNSTDLDISDKLKGIIKKIIEGSSLTLRDNAEVDKITAEFSVYDNYIVVWFSSPFNCLSSVLTTLMISSKHLQNVIMDFVDTNVKITDDEKIELCKIYEAYSDENEGKYNYLENLSYNEDIIIVKLENIKYNLY